MTLLVPPECEAWAKRRLLRLTTFAAAWLVLAHRLRRSATRSSVKRLFRLRVACAPETLVKRVLIAARKNGELPRKAATKSGSLLNANVYHTPSKDGPTEAFLEETPL